MGELLAPQGIVVPERTLHRYANEACGHGRECVETVYHVWSPPSVHFFVRACRRDRAGPLAPDRQGVETVREAVRPSSLERRLQSERRNTSDKQRSRDGKSQPIAVWGEQPSPATAPLRRSRKGQCGESERTNPSQPGAS